MTSAKAKDREPLRFAGLLAVGVLVVGALAGPDWCQAESALVGHVAQPIDGVIVAGHGATEGDRLSLDQLRGHVVLVDFWASWCPPCRDETPDLQSFFEHNANEGLVVLGVNQQEKADAANTFLREFGVTYPVVLDTDGEVSETYGVGRGLPISFLIAPSGVIEKVYFGRLSDDNFNEIAAKLQ